MNSLDILKITNDALAEKKGINIKAIDISNISVMADYFIIVSGSSSKQVQALADNVSLKLAENKLHPKSIEGYDKANWILMDIEDVIVHIFDKESREFYDLERIWSDGKEVNL